MNIPMKDIEDENGNSITFPGGMFYLTKCSTGEIWAHLVVGSESEIVESRMDTKPGTTFKDGRNVKEIEDAEISSHFAIKMSVNY